MFAPRYFPNRYFAPRYFAPAGAAVSAGTLTNKQVVASVLNWLNDNYAGTIDWDAPAKFDHETDSLEDWIQPHVSRLQRTSRRRTGQVLIKSRIVIMCFARTQSDLYAANTLANTVAQLLNQAVITIQDFEADGEPTVGYALLVEPQTKRVMKAGEANWKAFEVSVTAMIQEI